MNSFLLKLQNNENSEFDLGDERKNHHDDVAGCVR